ncbi:tripartite motif-containing protein 16-like [Halichoeres trimaculatus]|uniref:tripartite motif-containing protein 16-like n=1 Tax=Halichoeres trimaculatus TaxID=147232 RepID=UPI003D9EA858
MAESQKEHGVELEPSQFCCSVCLDLLKDPVTIPCGHSYCKGCIEGFWDQNEEKGNCTCPQCRETLNPRPVLRRNHMLAEVVEMIKRRDTQLSPSLPEATTADAEACSGPEDVPCDFCPETNPRKATMSCLACVASFCPVHLEPHYSVPVLKTHQLVSASVPLQEKMCTKHNKLMEVYCRTDRKCICYLCVIDEHKSHNTVSAAAEREEQQKELTVNQKKVQERGKGRENELTELLEALKDFKESSQAAVESSKKIFGDLTLFLKQNCTLVKQLIQDQEEVAVAQAEELQLQLEEEITKLKQRDTELERISHVDDHIHFIQTFQSLSASCESPHLADGLVVRPKHTFRKVTDAMMELKDDIESLLKQRLSRITSTVSTVNVLKQPEPKTRGKFLRYSCPLKLDQTAVSQNMTLSQEHLRATTKTEKRLYNNHSDIQMYKIKKITDTEQVWCCEALTQRCYWEVYLYGYSWSVAVSYKDKNQTTFNSEFGQDNRSWSLEVSSSCCSFRHNNQTKRVLDSSCSQIGVYLDYPEGILSFYGVSSSRMTLLHRVENTFTEPLYPCIGFRDDAYNIDMACFARINKIW